MWPDIHLFLCTKAGQVSGFLLILQMKTCSNILVLKETRGDSMECFACFVFLCHLEEIVIHHLLVY